MSLNPEPYDHYRRTDTGSVYRVVGVHEDSVVLLEVGDSDGKRLNTGNVTRVREERLQKEYEDAPNPDDGFGIRSLRNIVDGVLWTPRAVVDRLK